MDERELEAWAEKHRELARQARRERRNAVVLVVWGVLMLAFLYWELSGVGEGGGTGIGPSLF